jgi:hypothetical protein
MENCKNCGYELRDILGLSYQTYVKNLRSHIVDGIRMISGSFKEKGSNKIITGDDFHVLVCGDALKSYTLAIDYFNHTLQTGEKKRTPVSAKWIECKKLTEVKSGCDANNDGIPPNNKLLGILPNEL